MQLYEKIAGDQKDSKKTNEILGCLNSLSHSATSWKTVHMKYHALQNDVMELISIFTVKEGGVSKISVATDAIALAIKHKIDTSTFGGVLNSFVTDLAPSINELTFFHNEAMASFDEKVDDLRKKGESDLARMLARLHYCRGNVLDSHEQFTSFVNQVRNKRNNNAWRARDAQLFIEHHVTLRDSVPSVIYNTDGALMVLLELLKLFTLQIPSVKDLQ